MRRGQLKTGLIREIRVTKTVALNAEALIVPVTLQRLRAEILDLAFHYLIMTGLVVM